MKPMQLIHLLVALALLLTPQHASAKTDETSHLTGQAKTIADTVIAAQRAGWEDHDYKQYMTQWADEATLTWGRTDEPGKYDQPIDLEQIRATRKIRMRGTPPKDQYAYKVDKVEIDGDTATLRLTVHVTGEDENFESRMGEQYQLIKTDAGWKVTANRVWPISNRFGDRKVVYNAKLWARLDTAVARVRAYSKERDQSYALMNAYRFDEAYAAAVKATEAEGATAEDWSTRGYFAAIAGQADDVDPCLTKARSMDPDVWLPAFAPEETKE